MSRPLPFRTILALVLGLFLAIGGAAFAHDDMQMTDEDGDGARDCVPSANSQASSHNHFLAICVTCLKHSTRPGDKENVGLCPSWGDSWCLSKGREACTNEALGCKDLPTVGCSSASFPSRNTPTSDPTVPAAQPPNPTTKQQPSTTPQPQPSITPQAPSTGSADGDVNSCMMARNNATSSCSSTSQTNQQGPLPGEGIPQFCARMRNATNGGTLGNNSAGSQCLSAYTNCAKTCDSGASRWSSNPSAASSMQSAASYCRGLDSQVQALGNQGLSLGRNLISKTLNLGCGPSSDISLLPVKNRSAPAHISVASRNIKGRYGDYNKQR